MKGNVRIAGIMLIVLLGATGCNYVHRGVRDFYDHAMFRRHHQRMTRGDMYYNEYFMNRGQGRCMNPDGLHRRRQGRYEDMGPGSGMRGRREAGPAGWMGRRMGPPVYGQMDRHYRMVDRIPDLTDKQRKEIALIRQNQTEKMDQIREETFGKMQNIREDGRAKIMNILTDEQKKFLESAPHYGRQPATVSSN